MVNKLVLHVATNKCSPEQRRSTSCLLKKVIFDENSSVTHVVFYMNTTGKECPVFTYEVTSQHLTITLFLHLSDGVMLCPEAFPESLQKTRDFDQTCMKLLTAKQ